MYQVVLLAAGGTSLENDVQRALRRTLERKVGELGLQPGELIFFDEPGVTGGQLDEALPTAAVYVSNTAGPAASVALRALQEQAVLVVPVVSSLARFTQLVPLELTAVNGTAPAPGDPDHEGIANRVLEELRLLRRNRRAFISYRRVESSGVAEQLRVELERRRYDVFLDTFSVEHGVDFQSALWDQMADTDVIVLLNTKTVFDSRWVELEVTRADKSGIGVVQIIWPDVTRQRELELAEPHYLAEHNFDGASSTDGTATLTATVAESCAITVERIRARAQAARRRRVVAELQAACDRRGVRVILERNGLILLERPATTLAAGKTQQLAPFVGYPSAVLIHDHVKDRGAPVPILYDALGILDSRKAHLGWLNDYLPARSVAVQDLEPWLTQHIL